jgi:hypothetical protein
MHPEKTKIQKIEHKITLLKDVLNTPNPIFKLKKWEQKILKRILSEYEYKIKMLTMQD